MGTEHADADRRTGDRRDRRGRGLRGPLALAGPYTPDGIPATRRVDDRFDDLVLAIVDGFRERFADRMRDVDVGVEPYPVVPDDWYQPVPYATCTAAHRTEPARIVLFERPLVTHAETMTELAELIHLALVEQLALLWGVTPHEIDPDI